MARPLRYGPPLKTRLLPEDEARFESERIQRGITRSELAREKISFQLTVEKQLTDAANIGMAAGDIVRTLSQKAADFEAKMVDVASMAPDVDYEKIRAAALRLASRLPGSVLDLDPEAIMAEARK